MLPREKRIARKLWSPLLASRNFKNSTYFSLRSAPGESQARFAVSVSKKVSKSAVVRNRVRRRVYAALEDFASITPGLYLFSAKPGAEKVWGEDLKKELRKLL